MKKLLFLCLIPFSIIGQNISNLPNLIQKCDPSIIKIYTINSQDNPEKQGSGVIINADGTGITNFHVLAGAKKVIAYDLNGNKYDLNTILDYNEETDLIKFKLTTNKRLSYAKITNDAITKGSSVFAIGFPNGFSLDGESTVSTGIISGSRSINNIKFIQTTTPITHGSSGGGLFNVNGNLCGITSGTFAEDIKDRHANLNKVISSSYINDLSQNKNLSIIDFYNEIRNTNIYTQAFEFYDNANFNEAEELFIKHLEMFPDDAVAWFRLGNCYTQGCYHNIESRACLENATLCYKNAISLDSTYFYPYYQAAITSIYLEDQYQSEIYAKTAYNLQPKTSEGNYILGYYYNDVQDYNKSIFYFTNAINYTSSDFDKAKLHNLYLERAIAKSLLHTDFSADSDYRKCLELNPKNQNGLSNYGMFLYNRDDKKNACIIWNKLKQINPSYNIPGLGELRSNLSKVCK